MATIDVYSGNSIQDAINGASENDTIIVHAGTYNENLIVNVAGLTIQAAEGDAVTIAGTFRSDNGLGPTDSVADFLKTSTTDFVTGSGIGVSVAADNVTIKGVTIESFQIGINLGTSIDHTRIENVVIDDTVDGIRKGSAAVVTDLDIVGGAITDSYVGVYIAKETASGGDLDDMLIDGTAFSHLVEKGLYFETLSDALITGITMDDVGQWGRGAAPVFTGGVDANIGGFGAGIDINLKWDHEATSDTVDDDAPYSDITIEDFTFTDVGMSDKDGGGDPHAYGAAIAVKARDQGSYASPEQATFTGTVVIQNGTIDGTSTAIRAGEPGQSIGDPAVTITNVGITGAVHSATHGDVDNVTQSTTTVTLADGGDSLDAHATATGDFIVTGGDGADTIKTGAGDDTITGGGGADTIDGRDGLDTAVYSATIDADRVSATGSGWSVNAGATEGTDALANIEVIDGAGAGEILLVGNGGYATIQAAIDAAGEGDTILVAAGTYDETLVISTDGLTIRGAEPGVVINGTFSEDNTGFTGGSLATWLKTATGYAGNGIGIGVHADGVVIENLTVTDNVWGIELGDNTDGTHLKDVTITSNVYGIYKQGQSNVTDLAIEGGAISDGFNGIDFEKDSSSPSTATEGLVEGVLIDGVTFEHLLRKGIYAEALSDAHLTNLTMSDVGQFGGTTFNGSLGAGGNGININLKNGTYSDIVIDNFTMTDVGASNRDGAGSFHQNGGAIVVEVRDQGSYSGAPATYLGFVVVENGSIDGTTSTGIHTGEPGQTNAGPALIVNNVAIADGSAQHLALHGEIANVTGSIMIVDMTSGDDVVNASPSTIGSIIIDGLDGNDTLVGGQAADTIKGSDGNDTLTGREGNDQLRGGDGSDTVDYSIVSGGGAVIVNLSSTSYGGIAAGKAKDTHGTTDTLQSIENVTAGVATDDTVILNGASTDYTFALTGGVWTATKIVGGAVTVLDGIEKAVFQGDGHTVFFIDQDAGGSDATGIQAAIDAASSGDIIAVGAGSYAGNLVIGVGLSLAASGVVTLTGSGGSAVSFAGDLGGADVSISGFAITGGTAGVSVAGTDNLGTLTLDGVDINGNAQYGLRVDDDGATAISVTDSSFSNNAYQNNFNGSAHIKLFGFSGDALFRDVTIDGASDATAQNDRPDYGIELHGITNAEIGVDPEPALGTVVFDGVTIDGAFHKTGVAINNYADVSGLAVDDLDLSGVATNWGQVLLLDGILSDIDATGYDIAFPTGADLPTDGIVAEWQGDVAGQAATDQTIRGTGANERLIGKGGNDTLHGGGGNDELYGHDKPGGGQAGDAGNDALYGEAGNDTLSGGAGNDTLDGGTGADAMAGGTGDDTYVVDNAGDTVDETGGGGTDTVRASISFVLGADFEDLVLTGGGAINGTGNADANTITGNAAANTLNGGAGADLLRGLGGNDVYLVDDALDVVDETFAGSGGTDRVMASVSYTLGADVENLTLTGAAAIDGTGNGLANAITGNGAANLLAGLDGNDSLSGGLGNDTLSGGLGKDLLIGGGGKDSFVFDTAVSAATADTIDDFSAKDDTIVLSRTVFAKLKLGALAAKDFGVGTVAAAKDTHAVYYQKNTGILSYDVNGAAKGGDVAFAVLDKNLALTAADFLVIS